MIDTRFTRKFGLTCPVGLAPMADAAGGKLAAAVAKAGGLGLIGGGHCDHAWIDAQFEEAGGEAVGCGFFSWKLAQVPGLLESVLRRRPRAVYLSHGDPRPFADSVRRARVPLICQVHSLQEARYAVEAEAEVIVAQGAAAGGQGGARSVMTLVPEIADYLHDAAHDTLLLAAGGITDSRGLAAAIAMGADGAVMGTRFWASQEALVPPVRLQAALAADGDGTVQTQAKEPVSGGDWPGSSLERVLAEQPEKPVGALDQSSKGQEDGNESGGAIAVGEGIGIIRSAPPAAEILEIISRRAERILTNAGRKVIC